MTADEYRSALKSLGLTQNEAGRWLGVHEQSGRRWAVDGPPVPVAKFLNLVMALGLSPQKAEEIIDCFKRPRSKTKKPCGLKASAPYRNAALKLLSDTRRIEPA